MKVKLLILTLLLTSLTTTEIIFSAPSANPTLGEKRKRDADDGDKTSPSKLFAQVGEEKEAPQCSICLQEENEKDGNGIFMTAKEAKQFLTCTHREFHETCLTQALATNPSCPNCRQAAVGADYSEEEFDSEEEDDEDAPALTLNDAVVQNNLGAVRALLAAGDNLNAADEEEWTPLHYAAWVGPVVIVQALIDAGANINAADEQRSTPLHIAAVRGSVAAVQALLAAGANINAANEEEWTPLHYAAFFGHVAVVQALLTAGADRTITADDGQTAAQVARTPEIANLITQYQPVVARNARFFNCAIS